MHAAVRDLRYYPISQGQINKKGKSSDKEQNVLFMMPSELIKFL